MGKTLATHLSDVRSDLKDAAATWSDAELTRALAHAYADLSRFLPQEKFYEERLVFDVTDEHFTTGAAHGTASSAVTYHPIKYESELVRSTDNVTTYTRNTDYFVDYMNGTITTISGGAMVVATIYHVSYTKSKVAVNLSSLAPIRVGTVEYPAHSVPKQIVSTELYSDVLVVKCGDDTQDSMTLNKHILVQYFTAHTISGTSAGTCPAFLDETVNLAMAAYALFQKAIQYELQSVTDLASARTALASIAAIHVLVGTALAKVSTYNTDADTALDLVKTNNDLADTALDSALANIVLGVGELANLTAVYTLVDTALAKVSTYNTDADTALDAVKTNNDLADVALDAALANIALGIVELANLTSIYALVGTSLTAAETAFAAGTTALGTLTTPLAAISTALAKVITYSEGATDSSKAILAQIATDIANLRTGAETAVDAAVTALGLVVSTDLTGYAAVWTDEVKHILNGDSGVTPSMELHLELGDDFINTVNIGSDVPALYAQYAATVVNMQRAWAQKRVDFISAANARTSQAATYLQEAQVRLANLSTYIDQARAYGDISDDFLNEAQAWIGKCNQIISEASQDIGIGNGYVSSAGMRLYEMDRYLAEADRYFAAATQGISAAQGWAAISDRYIAEAQARIAMENAFINEAQTRIAEMDRYLGESDRYFAAASQDVAAAQGWVAISDRYTTEANGRIAMENAFIAEAQTRIAEIDRYIEEANRYTEAANVDLLLADKFRTEATERRNECWSIWGDKKQYTGRLADISNKQVVR